MLARITVLEGHVTTLINSDDRLADRVASLDIRLSTKIDGMQIIMHRVHGALRMLMALGSIAVGGAAVARSLGLL
jgi:hypothetical protein